MEDTAKNWATRRAVKNTKKTVRFALATQTLLAKKYKEFAKEFSGWKDPKIKEESPLREYILATYNKEIAAKYDVKPCPDVPASYFRVLSSINTVKKTHRYSVKFSPNRHSAI